MKNTLNLLLPLLACLFACNADDDTPQKLVPPSDLSLELIQSEENPGVVTITYTAKNTNYYKVYFGDVADETPSNVKIQEATHTYAASGNYIIKVQAHATDAVFATTEKEITIDLEEDEEESLIPTSGYVSPEAYEGMALVWEDQFEGTELNTDNWTFEIGTGGSGWGNNELQYYREENTTLQEGFLIITAKEEAFEGSDYTSSRIITKGKQSFQYGRIDIRAALPQGQGIWPALWMLGANIDTEPWPASGEIDIMEMVGGDEEGKGDNITHGTAHWADANGQRAMYGNSTTLEDGIFADEFHVFSIVWDENTITWYLDDVQFNEIDTTPADLSEFQKEFFLIFNVAVGGDWPGSPDESTTFPQSMIVDYVRVFQAN